VQQVCLGLIKVLVLGEVDQRLNLPSREQQLFPPRLVLATQRSRVSAYSRTTLLLRLCGKRVTQGFNLSKVEPVVEEGALGELARLGVSDTLGCGASWDRG
jgi:hypothetical protein